MNSVIKHNKNLDILRGVAALTVVLHHIVSYSNGFDKRYSLDSWLHYNFPAHLAVLVFFILSGYVIRINTRPMQTGADIRTYLKKRLVRIYPIYLIAILFTCLISQEHSIPKILSNVFLISVPLDNVMIEDAPLWSLQYEVLYYIVFIAFSYFKINLRNTIITLLSLIVLLFVAAHRVTVPPLIASYLIGFLIWISGCAIAELNMRDTRPWTLSHMRLISIFLLMFSLLSFNPYGPLLKMMHTSDIVIGNLSMFQQSISYIDLFYFLYVVGLMLVMTHTRVRFGNAIILSVFGLAVFRLALLVKTYGFHFMVAEHYVLPALLLCCSIALWFLPFNLPLSVLKPIRKTAGLSNISYALYIIHLPLLFFFGSFTAVNSTMFLLKACLYLAVVMGIAYVLEEKFQPRIKRLLLKKKVAPAQPVPVPGLTSNGTY
jgi:peptidoglycan/LPS O-acetylase OafA/YrhL